MNEAQASLLIEQVADSILRSLVGSIKYESSARENAYEGDREVRSVVFVRPGKTTKVELPNTFRGVGVVMIQLFSPLGVGKKKVNDISGTLLSGMRSRTLAGIRFRDGYPMVVGEQNGEFQLNVVIEYEHDFNEVP